MNAAPCIQMTLSFPLALPQPCLRHARTHSHMHTHTKNSHLPPSPLLFFDSLISLCVSSLTIARSYTSSPPKKKKKKKKKKKTQLKTTQQQQQQPKTKTKNKTNNEKEKQTNKKSPTKQTTANKITNFAPFYSHLSHKSYGNNGEFTHEEIHSLFWNTRIQPTISYLIKTIPFNLILAISPVNQIPLASLTVQQLYRMARFESPLKWQKHGVFHGVNISLTDYWSSAQTKPIICLHVLERPLKKKTTTHTRNSYWEIKHKV